MLESNKTLCLWRNFRSGSSIKYERKIFRKANISKPLIHTRTCAYQGVRNVSFSENFAYVLNGWPLHRICLPGIAFVTTTKIYSIVGLILATYCMRKMKAGLFFRNKIRYSLFKPSKPHAVYGSCSILNTQNLEKLWVKTLNYALSFSCSSPYTERMPLFSWITPGLVVPKTFFPLLVIRSLFWIRFHIVYFGQCFCICLWCPFFRKILIHF